MSGRQMLQFIDIGANLADCMFGGIYNGTQKHLADVEQVLQRSWDIGMKKIIVTGTSLSESKAALYLAKKNSNLYSSVGCHPTCCNEFEQHDESGSYLLSLVELCKNNGGKVVALGEFGLDYRRLHFCVKETQIKWFEMQLIAFEDIQLPLFLHCRDAAPDLIEILNRNRDKFDTGVVHSFDGTLSDARKILDLGLYIGVNGCSLKTEENLQVIKEIPSEKILLETDSPYCEIRPSHAGFKYVQTKFPSTTKEKWQPDKLIRGRNEPCNILQVLEVISEIRGEDINSLGETIYKNTEKLFFSQE